MMTKVTSRTQALVFCLPHYQLMTHYVRDNFSSQVNEPHMSTNSFSTLMRREKKSHIRILADD